MHALHAGEMCASRKRLDWAALRSWGGAKKPPMLDHPMSRHAAGSATHRQLPADEAARAGSAGPQGPRQQNFLSISAGRQLWPPRALIRPLAVRPYRGPPLLESLASSPVYIYRPMVVFRADLGVSSCRASQRRARGSPPQFPLPPDLAVVVRLPGPPPSGSRVALGAAAISSAAPCFTPVTAETCHPHRGPQQERVADSHTDAPIRT